MESSDFVNSSFDYPGFKGTISELSKILRETAVDYESSMDKSGKKKDPYEMSKYNARAASLRAVADRIETAGSADAAYTMLAEQNIQFFNNRVVNNVIGKRRRGGKSRKGRKSRKGKTRKLRKSKTRRH